MSEPILSCHVTYHAMPRQVMTSHVTSQDMYPENLIFPTLKKGNINSEPPSGSWSACVRSQSYYYYIIQVPNSFIIGTSHMNIFILLYDINCNYVSIIASSVVSSVNLKMSRFVDLICQVCTYHWDICRSQLFRSYLTILM